MGTVAVHVNDPDGFDVYCGRPIRSHADARVRAGSRYANRYKVGVDGSLRDCLEFYLLWLDETVEGRIVLGLVHELRGGRLGCWCAKKGVQLTASDPLICHCQLLAGLAEGTHDFSAFASRLQQPPSLFDDSVWTGEGS